MTDDHGDAPAAPHRHSWPAIEFSFEDGHPWMTKRCPCGAERRIRAYERSWDPATDPPSDAQGDPPDGEPLRR